MSKEKESKQQRKDRITKQSVVIQEWCSEVRKHIKLPDGLKGTLIALVDASRKGRLKVHVYQEGAKAGQLIVQKQNDIVPDLKFWMVGSPKAKDDDEPPSLQLFLKRKQDVSVYSGNHYITVTVPIDRISQLTKQEKLKLFAK
ncbi:hypothetical protein [Pseudomonas viridiflava]|uniref:hypothetical protein n=1 Tax=Pseudomonas viridiflava TaxID=33069 RepID=UPI000F03F979|nr:hypothetical protein [Pseudomonas viridiflava]